MAIQGGAKELKYPLPNMAQINAQQSAASASSGGSASSSAYSTNRNFAANKMRVQADLANSAAERDFRARSQMEGQAFRAQQEFYDRENQKGSQLEAQRFRAEEAGLDREFTTQRDKVLFEQDQVAFERKRDAEIEMNIQSGNLELPPDAQAEMDKLEAGRRDAPKIVDSPEQQAEFDRQYEARKRQILRSARPPAGPSADERARQNQAFYNPETGAYSPTMQPGFRPGTVDENGVFQETVSETDQRQREAEQKQAEADLKAEQQRREMEQKQKEDIYKDAKDILGEGRVGETFESAYEKALQRRRAAGIPTPEQAPAAPPGEGLAPPQGMGESTGQVPLPPGHPNAAPPAGQPNAVAPQGPPAIQKPDGTYGAATIAPDVFKKQWSTLKPGESMAGPDGKTYIKK